MSSAAFFLNHFIFHSVFTGPDDDQALVETFGILGHNMLSAILPSWSHSIAALLDAVEKAEKEEICFRLACWINLIVQRWKSE